MKDLAQGSENLHWGFGRWQEHSAASEVSHKGSMATRFSKTPAGRDEIKARSRRLSRSARNLLLILDESRPVESWVQLVHGATDEDTRQLLREGLIHEHFDAAVARSTAVRAVSLAEALAHLNYDQLYSLLTSQAKERLGLIAGFKFVLEVEKCVNIDEMRKLAERFLSLVKQHQGEAAERQMRIALSAVA